MGKLVFKLRSEEEGVISKADPKSVVNAIKKNVAEALMGKGIPAAFSIPVDCTTMDGKCKITGRIDAKVIASAMDGHFMWHLGGNISVGSLPVLSVNGNLPLPKDDRYYLASDVVKVYGIAKKAQAKKALTPDEQALLDSVLHDSEAEDAALSEGESTGEEETISA